MKIDRRGFLVASSSALVLGSKPLALAASEQPSETPEAPDFDRSVQVVALLLGGGLALSAHGTKATARAAINLSPEPVSNIVVSLAEDVVAFSTILLSVFLPLVTIIFLVTFLALSIYVAPRMVRVLRGAISRVRGVLGYS